jgi:cell division protein ZapE
MDLFYESLPFPEKLRLHFHRFMQYVHVELKRHSGTVNPLERVADSLSERCRVLCFDEFFVSDIGDAMILGELLRALFDRGVSLVATSNIEPGGLYPNGLQRRRFLPAIDLLRQHTAVVHLTSLEDYRLRVLSQAEIYYTPLGDDAERSLCRSFMALTPGDVLERQVLDILGRPIESRYLSEDVVWFDFRALCDGPRSQNDYIEVARLFHAVLISDVPCFRQNADDQARRFISLVDEFYDHNVKLILSAEVAAASLYGGNNLAFEFERTRSRLIEMQSTEYLSRTHRG